MLSFVGDRVMEDAMEFAPEPFRSACLAVMYRAILEARALGWKMMSGGDAAASVNAEQIADVMDAVHNLPGLMRNWDHSRQEWLRRTLHDYDAKWGAEGAHLLWTYDNAISEASK
jgi:hypothetical protein